MQCCVGRYNLVEGVYIPALTRTCPSSGVFPEGWMMRPKLLNKQMHMRWTDGETFS
uniref:Uncharacterized protein n=1 Tax=Anguilla anguilla TaxID=7936 RepID=A0A0E9V172_ANGAN